MCSRKHTYNNVKGREKVIRKIKNKRTYLLFPVSHSEAGSRCHTKKWRSVVVLTPYRPALLTLRTLLSRRIELSNSSQV